MRERHAYGREVRAGTHVRRIGGGTLLPLANRTVGVPSSLKHHAGRMRAPTNPGRDSRMTSNSVFAFSRSPLSMSVPANFVRISMKRGRTLIAAS